MDHCRKALYTLRNLLTSSPVLHIFISRSDLKVFTDASKIGFGAVLIQKSLDGLFHPVQYMSKKNINLRGEVNSYELQVLAVIEALKKFHVYLHGTRFRVFTDCQAFQKSLDKKDLARKIVRWALFFQEFDFEIKHRQKWIMWTREETFLLCTSRTTNSH